jgi:3-oxoacyl-(acyl-carrier-protein) synthase
MTATLYTRVALRAWECRSAAGDAAAAWAAVASRSSALRHVPGRGWCGVVNAAGGDPVGMLHAAAHGPWTALAQGVGLPALGLSASKGDPWALDRALNKQPAAWLSADGAAVNQAVAARLGIRHYVPCAVAAACSTGIYALLSAADLIERGHCAQGLAGAVDGDLPPWLAAGFASMGVLCGDRRPVAFGGLMQAEACAPEVLGAQASACFANSSQQAEACAPGEATGFAPAAGAGVLALEEDGPWRLAAGVRLGDAGHETHFTDPRTLTTALAALWVALPNPDLIVTHGTGTAAGDAYEAAGLMAGPWRRAEQVSMKPILGHCLGASGAVELAAACCAPVRRLWKLSLGFGGHLAAVALART